MFFKKIIDFIQGLSLRVGVDMGSKNMRIGVVENKFVLKEATCVVRKRKKRWSGMGAPVSTGGEVVVFGDEALLMNGREPKNLEVVFPIKRGMVSDFEGLEQLMFYLWGKIGSNQIDSKIRPFKPRLLVAVGDQSTGVEKRAIRALFTKVGAGKVETIDSQLAVAVGLGMRMDKKSIVLVVDVGAEKTEISIMSQGGVVDSRRLGFGGSDWNRDIVNFLKLKYGILISEAAAERLKISIGSMVGGIGNKIENVRGKDLASGGPRSINVSRNEIVDSMALGAMKIGIVTKEILEESPHEIAGEILNGGIWLIGGGSKIGGLAQVIEEHTGIHVNQVEDCQDVVLKGCIKILTDEEIYQRLKILGCIV